MLEQLRVEGILGEVAVEEHNDRVVPGLGRRSDQQRLRRRLDDRRRPGALLGLVDSAKTDTMASMIEHVSCRRHAVKKQQ